MSDPSPRSVKAAQMEPERLRTKEFVELRSFKSGVKGRRSNWRLQGLWWGDACKMKWTTSNEEDSGGLTTVTTDEELILHVDW